MPRFLRGAHSAGRPRHSREDSQSRFFIRNPVTPRTPRCEWICALSAAPSWPLNRAFTIRPLPEGSVVGTHMPNVFTPLASGVANL